MVRAWYMDESDDDQRLPHMLQPNQEVNLEDLKKVCGLSYCKVDADNIEGDATVQRLRKEVYNYEDSVTINESLPNYQQLIEKFYKEHIHTDDEVRLVVEGGGYFDVRNPRDDRWIRIEVTKHDLIILPAGAYHRFTLDSKNHIVANRYFQGVPVWTPLHRPQDDHPIRTQYLKERGMEA